MEQPLKAIKYEGKIFSLLTYRIVDKEKNNCILATGTVVVVIYNNKFWILPYVLKIVFRYL